MASEPSKSEVTCVERAASESEDRALFTTKEDRRMIRKCDLHVVPILYFMFMLGYLDRSNLGNARIQGMEKDLNMKQNSYNIAASVFYVAYIAFEVPSNLILKRLAPSTWLSTILFFWGVSAMCQGLVQNTAGLIVCRFFLGMFEAGCAPGCLYVMNMYYARYELQRRLTLLFASGVVAGSFSGLLAFALAKLDGVGRLAGWRWIFIIEGLITIAASFAAKFIITDWPENARFLTAREKARIAERLSIEAAQGVARMDRLDSAAIRRIVFDWKVWIGIFMYLGAVNTGFVTSVFLPTILKELGYTASIAQVRTIPIYLVAAVCMFANAYASDKSRHRYGFIIIGASVTSIGYVMLLNQHLLPGSVRYMAVFFVVAGGQSTHPITLGWLANNVSGSYKRAISSAMQLSLGNFAGVIGSNIFLSREAPLFHTGYATSLGLMLMCATMATVFLFGVKWENRQRDMGKRDGRLLLADVDNLGDDHPSFRYCK